MSTADDTLESLPADVEGLRALVLTLMAEHDAAISERDVLQTQNDRIRHLLLKLQRMQFGPKSERLPEEQLQLGLEALEQVLPAARPRRRSAIPSCKRLAWPSTAPAAGPCRRICRASR